MEEQCTWLCETCLSAFELSDGETTAPVVGTCSDRDNGGSPASPSAKRKKEAPATPALCQCCLGLLAPCYHETLVQTVNARLHEEGYQGLTGFHLCLQLPPQLALLLESTRLTLATSSQQPVTTPFSSYVKDHLRTSLCRLLEHDLALTAQVNSSFQVTLKLTHEQSANRYRSLIETFLPSLSRSQRHSRQITQSIVEQVLPHLSLVSLQAEGLVPSNSVFNSYPIATVSFSQASIFVAGRYNKYSRTLSQTPWFVEGTRRGETSVQELICSPLQAVVKANNICFSSSGREDVDVRMLGNGRPFLLEFVDPHCQLNKELCHTLEEKINLSTDLISVRQLTVVSKKAQCLLKEGEEKKKKHYRALVWSSQPVSQSAVVSLSSTHDLKIAQKTPIRVLHRRSVATRERMVYTMQGEPVDSHHFYLYMVTQAGTYIKEFVHGDFGRTVPNLCLLLEQEVDILTLDVMEVGLEWPPE